MKPYIIHSLFFLIAVGSGVTTGYLLSNKLHDQADFRLQLVWELERDNAEFMTGIHLATIQAIEREEYQRALQWNCVFLQAGLSRIQPERHEHPNQRNRVETRLENAIAVVSRLEEEGLCDWP